MSTPAPLVSLQIDRPNDPELAQSDGIVAIAQAYVVADQESYDLAGQKVRQIAGAAKRLEERRLAITRPMDAAKASVMDLFRKPLERFAEARRIVEGKMIAHQRAEQEKARAREAEQRRLAEEAARKAGAEALQRAEEAEAAGDTAGSEKALAEAVAPPPPAPVVPHAAAPKAAGTSLRSVWKAECTDFESLLCHAVGISKEHLSKHANPIALALLKVDETVLGQQARALKDSLVLPGVRVWDDAKIAARGL